MPARLLRYHVSLGRVNRYILSSSSWGTTRFFPLSSRRILLLLNSPSSSSPCFSSMNHPQCASSSPHNGLLLRDNLVDGACRIMTSSSNNTRSRSFSDRSGNTGSEDPKVIEVSIEDENDPNRDNNHNSIRKKEGEEEEEEEEVEKQTIDNQDEYTQKVVIEMPDIGDMHAKGKISKWYKQEGDIVRPNDTICDIETDLFKFGMDVEDENEGIMKEILVQEGDEESLKPGTPICTIMHKPMK